MMRQEAPHVVRDHLNLTGTNPLVGPNDPCGERFPSVNDVYITDLCPNLPRGVAAGLVGGVFPTREEMEFLRSLGADFCCYNLVPTMIVAAHAGLKVLGLVVPEGVEVNPVLDVVLGS
jgi:purine-nucleoside phosphorylase